MFAISLLGSIGYLLEAIGVKVLMPSFGESALDHWRSFCFLIGCVALVSLPFAMALYESPSFLAVKGNDVACVEVLDSIAALNGKPAMQRPAMSGVPSMTTRRSSGSGNNFRDVADRVYMNASQDWFLIVMLCVIDSSRAFFVSGSSYLWKDLFLMGQGQSMSATTMNVIASVTPLVGLLLGVHLLWIGSRAITCAGCGIATFGLMALTNPAERTGWTLLILVMCVKLTYGPITTCVSLMKAESFPTEVRVSAFACISVASKMFCTLAPTLVEILRGSEIARSWSSSNLERYIAYLIMSTVTCGSLVWALPQGVGDGQSLEDYCVDRKRMKTTQLSKYGSCANVYELDPDLQTPMHRTNHSDVVSGNDSENDSA